MPWGQCKRGRPGEKSAQDSAGSICARGQAALQGLYNPDRLAHPLRRAADDTLHPISWDEASGLLNDHLRAAAEAGSERVAFIGAPQGPTLRKIIAAWLGGWRSGRHLVYYEPLSGEPARAAAELCFNRRDLPLYRLDRAEFILSFGADFLETWGSPVEMARQYAAFRAPVRRNGVLTTGRSVYVGPRLSLTAAKCDDWLAPKPGTEAIVALGVLNVLVNNGAVRREAELDLPALREFVAGYEPVTVATRTGVSPGMISKLGEWFGEADGAVALAGMDDKAAHVASFVLNAATGNVGRTVFFLDGAPAPAPSCLDEVNALVDTMRHGAVDVLVVAGGNPLFSMPSSSGFLEAIGRVPFVVWCGGVPDETASGANLLLPIHDQLETWSDAAPRPGLHTVAQPVMQPVFESRPLGDVLLGSARSAGSATQKVPWESTAQAVETTFRELYAGRGGAEAGFTDFWQRTKQEGGIFEDARIAQVRLQPAALKLPPPLSAAAPSEGLTLIAYTHIFLYDGRGADKPWSQEIPEPVSQFVWDSWAEMHPRALLSHQNRRARALHRANALPTVRSSAMRTGLSRLCRLPHRRRSERPGLQPLRRDAVLREQLPLQGPAVQLVRSRMARAVGVAGGLLLEAAEREPALTISLVIFFGAFEVFFLALVMFLGPTVIAAMTWWGILVANLLATAAMVAYFLSRHPGIARGLFGGWIFVAREGIVAGVMGAAIVALCFLGSDLAAQHPFRTPALLGATVFTGLKNPNLVQVTLPLVLGYTVLHFFAFAVFGLVAAVLIVAAEREPVLALGVFVLFAIFEVFFVGFVTLVNVLLLDTLGWWKIVIANILALTAMAGYFMLRHRGLHLRLIQRWAALEFEGEDVEGVSRLERPTGHQNV